MKKTCRAILLIALQILMLATGFAQSAKKPNILFVLADDWSPHAGVYGDKVIKTPTLIR